MIEDYSVLYVNNILMPTPSYGGYETKAEELVTATRSVTGDIIKKRLQNYLKHTVAIKWGGLTLTEKNLVMNACRAPSGSEYVSVRFFDLESSAYKTMTAYLGSDVTIKGYGQMAATSTGVTFQWYDVSLSLIEV